uniref:Uncharacterized protein n=1 Tax=Glossina pallidipes TaxID=7398 RepID=A0A1A9ZCH7_GLOPL
MSNNYEVEFSSNRPTKSYSVLEIRIRGINDIFFKTLTAATTTLESFDGYSSLALYLSGFPCILVLYSMYNKYAARSGAPGCLLLPQLKHQSTDVSPGAKARCTCLFQLVGGREKFKSTIK